MQVTQADLRTVLIRKDELSFYLRYNLYQDGEERFPESINCREDTVVAYFLTSTIRDYLRETAWGFAVERSWMIVPEGQFALSFCVDLPEPASFSLLFPAVAARSGEQLRLAGLAAAGQDTALPNGAYILGDRRSVLVFADPPPAPPGPGSVRCSRVEAEDGALVRTEIRLPGMPPGAPEPATPPLSAGRGSRRKPRLLSGYFAAEGDYEQTLRFNVVSAAPGAVFHRGMEAALERTVGTVAVRQVPDRGAGRTIVEEAIKACLGTHLVHRKGVHGLRTVPGAPELSSAAGVGLANLLLEVFPGNEEMVETALRLADFALKGQHPAGLFYDTYYLNGDSWLSPGSDPDAPPRIRLEDSAEVACSLLRLAETLEGLGHPADRYSLAGERMGEALLGSRLELADVGEVLHPDSLLSVGTGGGGIGLAELFLRLYRISGRDAHKKAVSALFRRFYGEPPESYHRLAALGAGGESGSAGIAEGSSGAVAWEETLPPERRAMSLEQDLLRARVGALLFESGHRPRGLEAYLNRLLPWICVNLRPLPDGLSMIGGMMAALGTGRLVFRGFELAYSALRLSRCLGRSSKSGLLQIVVPALLAFTLQKPIGTAWLALDPAVKNPTGPVDSRLAVRELEALLGLRQQFPEVLRAETDLGQKVE